MSESKLPTDVFYVHRSNGKSKIYAAEHLLKSGLRYGLPARRIYKAVGGIYNTIAWADVTSIYQDSDGKVRR